MKEKGFTLIELLVVIALIGLIMAFTIPVVMNSTNGSKEQAKIKTEIALKDSARMYSKEYPDNLFWFYEDMNDLNEYACVPLALIKEVGYLKNKNLNTKDFPDNTLIKISRNRETFVLNDEQIINDDACFSYDNVDPTLDIDLYYVDGSEQYNQDWTKKDVILTMNASDNIRLLKTEISSDNGNTWEVISANFTSQYIDNCNKKIKFRATDVFLKTVVKDVNIKIDKNDPSCEIEFDGTLGNNNWYISSNVYPKLKMGDNLSGIVSYGISATDTVDYNGKSKIDVFDDANGITYYGYVKDRAGNEFSCRNTLMKDSRDIEINIDEIPTSWKVAWNLSDSKSIPIPGYVIYGLSGGSTVCTAKILQDGQTRQVTVTNVHEINTALHQDDSTVTVECVGTGLNGKTIKVTKTCSVYRGWAPGIAGIPVGGSSSGSSSSGSGSSSSGTNSCPYSTKCSTTCYGSGTRSAMVNAGGTAIDMSGEMANYSYPCEVPCTKYRSC